MPAGLRLGGVSLQVADLERSLAYYTNVLGLRIVRRGDGSAVLGAGTVEIVMRSDALFLDFFEAFVGPLERELATRSTHRAGREASLALRLGDQRTRDLIDDLGP